MVLDDIGRPTPAALARALGVSSRDAARWCAGTAEPPRAVVLALFWLTRWGQSVVDAEAVNAASLAGQQLAAARREVASLRAELARLVAAGDWGCANDPTRLDLPAAPRVLPVYAVR